MGKVKKGPLRNRNGAYMNNCLCNLFDNDYIWLLLIALLIITCCCGR